MARRSSLSTLLLASLFLATGCSSFGGSDDNSADNDGGGEGSQTDLTGVEDELLLLINDERVTAGLPVLIRDPGIDTVMGFHGEYMADQQDLTHIDVAGRDSEARARYYGDAPAVRCLEIIQWWGGTPSGMVHYEGYFNSEDHHAAYMEEGIFNLGPTSHAGVTAVAGLGPAGTQYENRDGSWTGVMLCDREFEIVINP